MIQRLGEDWDGVGESAQRLAEGNPGRIALQPEELKGVLQGIAGVREALRRMCDVSVTRTTLRSAVREALTLVLRDHREEIFPEIVELRQRLDAPAPAAAPEAGLLAAAALPEVLPAAIEERLENFEERIRRLAAIDEEVQAAFSNLGGSVGALGTRVEAVEGRTGDLERRLELVEGAVARGELESGRLGEFQESVAELRARLVDLQGRVDQVDARVSAEAGGIVERLGVFDTRLGDFDGLLAAAGGKVESGVQRLESELGIVQGRVDGVEAGAREKIEAETRRLDAEIAGVKGNVEGLSGRVQDFDGRLRATDEKSEGHAKDVGARFGEFDRLLGEVKGSVQELAGKFEESDGRLRGEVDRLTTSLAEAATRLEEFRGRADELGARLTGAGERVDAVEQGLRKEIDGMVQALTERLAELRDMLGRVEATLPHRQAVEAVESRLGRLEERMARVSDHVENIDAGTPEVRSLAENFADVRRGISAVSSEIAEAGRGVSELRDSLSGRLAELGTLLEGGIARWEDDQSQVNERLSAIRDTLRDQLHEVSAQVREAENSFLARFVGKKDPGLKLSRDDWDKLAGKIEGIISGLESVLAKKLAGRAPPPH